MRKLSILIFLIVDLAYCYGQQKEFSCPLKGGKIEVYQYTSEVATKPGAVFRSKKAEVYNISMGTVKSIDTVAGLINVHIQAGEFFFSYHRFQNIAVTAGQIINKGELIGRIDKNEKLFLIMSRNNELVDPIEYIRCKSVEVRL